jgi:hypothetical protein
VSTRVGGVPEILPEDLISFADPDEDGARFSCRFVCKRGNCFFLSRRDPCAVRSNLYSQPRGALASASACASQELLLLGSNRRTDGKGVRHYPVDSATRSLDEDAKVSSRSLADEAHHDASQDADTRAIRGHHLLHHPRRGLFVLLVFGMVDSETRLGLCHTSLGSSPLCPGSSSLSCSKTGYSFFLLSLAR